MNEYFKNLGISFAISSLVDDIQLSKMEIPSKKLYVYTLTAKDKSFDYVIDIEKNTNNLDSEKVLLDVLQKAYASLSGDKESKYTFDDLPIDEYIAHILNMIKFKAKSAYDRFHNSSNLAHKFFGPEAEHLNQIDKTIMSLSKSYLENCDFQTNEYDVLENMFFTFDIIFGESGINSITLNTPINSSDIEDYYEDISQKIQQMKEYDASLQEYKDSIDPDMDMDDYVSNMFGDLGVDNEVEDENEEYFLSFEDLMNDVINKLFGQLETPSEPKDNIDPDMDMDDYVLKMLDDLDKYLDEKVNQDKPKEKSPSFEYLMNDVINKLSGQLETPSEPKDNINNTQAPKQETDNPEDSEDSSEQTR